MKIRLYLYFLPAALILFLPQHSLGDATLSLYGTFNSMGMIVEIDSADDPDQDSTVDLLYKTASGCHGITMPFIYPGAPIYVSPISHSGIMDRAPMPRQYI
ncbi:MAG: hypothetical protein JW927_15400 [Deltaproteobacteria bacterium]|nr:hypothetical protein [Deltaproteobacteria bacterium]